MKYDFQIKMIAVRHYLDGHDGFKITARKYQVPASSLRAWTAAYQFHGEQAFRKATHIYSEQFRAHVVNVTLREHLSMRSAAARFNIADYQTIKRWIMAAKNSAFPVLKERKNMAQKTQKTEIKPEDMTPAELLEEVRYLRAERAYNEKLDALMKSKTERKKKSTPSGH